jgi:ADP-heptose:LPS heptosyltransferase
VPGIRFVALQKDLPAEESALAKQLDLVLPNESFQHIAELVAGLDLVISVDSVWFHVAGALARPAWALVQSSPHWTWLLGRSDSPWYPTARLFRQQRPGDWPAVLEAVRQALVHWRKSP